MDERGADQASQLPAKKREANFREGGDPAIYASGSSPRHVRDHWPSESRQTHSLSWAITELQKDNDKRALAEARSLGCNFRDTAQSQAVIHRDSVGGWQHVVVSGQPKYRGNIRHSPSTRLDYALYRVVTGKLRVFFIPRNERTPRPGGHNTTFGYLKFRDEVRVQRFFVSDGDVVARIVHPVHNGWVTAKPKGGPWLVHLVGQHETSAQGSDRRLGYCKRTTARTSSQQMHSEQRVCSEIGVNGSGGRSVDLDDLLDPDYRPPAHATNMGITSMSLQPDTINNSLRICSRDDTGLPSTDGPRCIPCSVDFVINAGGPAASGSFCSRPAQAADAREVSTNTNFQAQASIEQQASAANALLPGTNEPMVVVGNLTSIGVDSSFFKNDRAFHEESTVEPSAVQTSENRQGFQAAWQTAKSSLKQVEGWGKSFGSLVTKLFAPPAAPSDAGDGAHDVPIPRRNIVVLRKQPSTANIDDAYNCSTTSCIAQF